MPGAHRGWSRPRRLPHFDAACQIQHVVFRLADAVPPGVRDDDTTLDAGYGARLLADQIAAGVVEEALLKSASDGRCVLHAWCVMPTHVHVLAEQRAGHQLSELIRAWKGASARAINLALGRQGRLWAPGYYDRFMRDEAQLAAALRYIEENPVMAGLAAKSSDWRFSSAWRRSGEG